MANSPSSDFKTEWIETLMSMWKSFGSKKYLGKRGARILRKSMQDTYVMLEMAKDEIERLEGESKRYSGQEDTLAKVKLQSAMDMIEAKKKGMDELQLRYRFLSTLVSLQEMVNGQKLLKNIDRVLKKKNLDQFKESTRESMESELRMKRSLETLEVYVEARRSPGSVRYSEASHASNEAGIKAVDGNRKEEEEDDEGVILS